MILPSHRLDLYFVPSDPDAYPVEGAASLFEDLRAREVIDDRGMAATRAGWLVQGGFRRLRIDDPGRMVLYANQVGGFRVACPNGPANIVAGFREALVAWKTGGLRTLDCPACGDRHGLEDLHFAPVAAFGRIAVVVADVETADPAPDAMAAMIEHLGPCRVVRIRV